MSRTKVKLPRAAQSYLNEETPLSPLQKSVIDRFHTWMNQRKLSLEQLQPSHIDSFLNCPDHKTLDPSTQAHYKARLDKYLNWLYQRRLIRFDPKTRRIIYQKTMPLPAAQFVQTLTPRLKPATCKAYRYILLCFHGWLNERGIPIEQLNRQYVIDWLNHLKSKGLQPASRELYIVYVRIYLRWLYEQGTIQTYPDELIRKSDFPKLPQYLPRPLPLLADRELQIRLSQSQCLYQLGLLLMRRTGLRISELISLGPDCIRADPKGNKFLKVPLGKLDNERLVPLDDKTIELVEQLKEKGKNNQNWLLQNKTGGKTNYKRYVEAMHKACDGLEIDGKRPPTDFGTHMLRPFLAAA
ncbi:MAG: site-specific integrase [Proteobacteria bacterium]|nr:site-specific integrase [Pseudomonadota bacterium]